MAMVGGLDLHRRQITFDGVEVESGEEWRGRIWQPDRGRFRRWLRGEVARRANGEVALAVEAARVGGMWWRRSRLPGSRRMWRSRRTRRRRGDASIGPRPTGPMPDCCGISSRPGSCRRAGSPRAGVGVARAGAVVQVAGRSAHGVVLTDPCRALPARRRGSRGRHPQRQDAGHVGRPQPVCTGPRVGQGRTSSLRCGRSTSTNTSMPEPAARRGLPGFISHR